ncbi:MAG: PhnA domain-containing protein [Bacteroidia bacterium]|nr:PhnA domain-containing protein [Bacteroidia bacterium]
MSIAQELEARSGSVCELCGASGDLKVFWVPGSPDQSSDSHIYICPTCEEQLLDAEKVDPNHWRCLNDSMWSPVPAVQVMAWRMLNQLKGEGWPLDLLEMMYLDEATSQWAKAGLTESGEEMPKHVDSNGNVLENGDTVTLIQSLDVKGANFTAKRGTAVRNITLVHDNHEHIEGRVEGQKIVILTKFVKKSK